MNSFILKCSNPSHHSSQILFICLQQKCKTKRKCCILCAQSLHKKHDIVSINKCLQIINKNTHQQITYNPQQKLTINKLFNKMKQQFKNNLNSMKTSFNMTIQKIQKNFEQFTKIFDIILNQSMNQSINQKILNSLHQSQNLLNQYLQFSQKAKNINFKPFQNMKTIMFKQIERIQNYLWNSTDFIDRQLHKLTKFTQKFKFSPKFYQQDFYFSQTNKALPISTPDSKNILQGLKSDYKFTINCFDKPLNETNNKFFIKINKNPSKKLWIGVCILDFVKRLKFMGHSGLNKGVYALDQSGQASSYQSNKGDNNASISAHHQMQLLHIPIINYQKPKPGFNFKQNDIIMVRIDYTYENLKFNVINKNFNPEQPVGMNNCMFEHNFNLQIKLEQGQIYPFVGFNGISEDQVSILSRQQVSKLITSLGNSFYLQIGEQYQEQEEQQMFNQFF